MNLTDSTYIDIDIYNYYTIMIGKITRNKKIYEVIKCVCENLYDTTYIKNKYNCDYFYRVPCSKINTYNKLQLDKFTNNNDYNIWFGKIEKDYGEIIVGDKINILYKLESNKIIPFQIFTNINIDNIMLNMDCERIYIATLKINKIYDSFFDYEFFGLFECIK